jgi:DNA-binding CsgD family transcriptional regulator
MAGQDSIDTRADESRLFMAIIGFIGFATALATVSLTVLEAARIPVLPAPLAGNALALLALMALLVAASLKSDSLMSQGVRRAMQAFALASGVAGICGLLLVPAGAQSLAFLLFAVFGCAGLILVWGSYLATQQHASILSISAASFIVIGLITALATWLSTAMTMVLLLLLFLISWLCCLMLGRAGVWAGELVGRVESMERGRDCKANNFTSVAVGLMLGASGAVIEQSPVLPERLDVLAFGLCIFVAGIVTFIFRKGGKLVFEDMLRRSLSFLAAVLLLPMAFLPGEWRLACACLLFCVAVVNTLIIFGAVSELIRLNMLSSTWIIGIDGSFFLGGAIAGVGVFEWGFGPQGDSLAPLALTLGLAFACIVLQIAIENRSSPIMAVLADKLDDADADATNSLAALSAKGGSVWHTKIDMVAQANDLSPREKEVMKLLARGRDTKYIMNHFVVAHSTVKTHVYNLYRKLGIHSRQELLDYIEGMHCESEEEALASAGTGSGGQAGEGAGGRAGAHGGQAAQRPSSASTSSLSNHSQNSR